MMKCSNIMEPIRIGNKIMRNRIMMAPMESRLNTMHGDVTPAMVDYYAERARGGSGAVVVENTYVDNKSARSGIISSGLYSEHMVAGKNLLAEGIKEFGALAILQLSHGGPQASPLANDGPILIPSEWEGMQFDKEYQVLTKEMIIEIEDSFALAAQRACTAEFDGIEIHAAHGYLLSSFLSPFKNNRTDEYGGSAENRARIILEIIEKIRRAVSPGFIVGVRMNAIDGVPNGVDVELAKETAKLFEDKVDYLSISAGIGPTVGTKLIPPLYVKDPTVLEEVCAVAETITKTPVFCMAGFNADTAISAMERGVMDGVVIGRALVADPELPMKIKEGRIEDIRPCCRGNEGCFSRMLKGQAIRCEINPQCGQEKRYEIKKTNEPKKVLVIGGGAAGIECARVADMIGHDVILAERSATLGGHLNEAGIPGFKGHTSKFMKWQINMLEKSNVDVRVNCEITEDNIDSFGADVIVAAIGSEYIVPRIPGADRCVAPDKVLRKGDDTTGKNVVVIGAGLVGAETALYLAEKGNKVTVIEMRDSIAPENDPVAAGVLADKLAENGVTVCLREEAIEICADYSVKTRTANGEGIHAAEMVVMAVGLKAEEQAIKAKADIRVIGDAKRAAKIYDCIHEAWFTAFNI